MNGDIPQRDNPAPSLWLILAIGAVMWAGEYLRRDLWEPDEARYALVAAEMREGHWLIPFRQGEFYSHKPPLMFWLINVGSLLTGGTIGNLAPRLPSLFGAVMSLWAATRLAALWFSTRASRLTLVLMPSTYLFWQKAGFGQIDMLLCGLEMVALSHLFTARGAGKVVTAYVFMGLGILAKGPVGLLVPLGVYAAATAAAGDPWALPRGHWLWGPLISLAFPGIWLGLAWWQGAPDGYFQELLLGQNLGRVTGEFGGHIKPFYYFLYYFPLDFLPWTLLLPVSIATLIGRSDTGPGARRLIAWIGLVVLFFSLSASKRNLYILLAYPAAALLVAGAADNWSRVRPFGLRVSSRGAQGLLGLLGLGMVTAALVPGLPFQQWTLLPGGAALLIAAGRSWRACGADPYHPRWLYILSIGMMTAFASVGALVFPALNPLKTPHALVAPAREFLDPGDRLLLYRMNGEIFSHYTGRKGLVVRTDDAFLQALHDGPQSRHLIVANERDWPRVAALLDSELTPIPFTSGSKELVYAAWTRDVTGSPPP